jgi:SOS response regulatory protein OraA/RecX
MIKFYIGSAYDPTQVIVSEDKTIRQAYQENDVALPNNAMVTLNSRKLSTSELDKTLTELEIKENDVITITEKYQSAR